jgi:branched-chain amino acid transport system ATP-binding protein
MAAIEVSSLSKSFGSFVAVSDVSLDVSDGARHAVLGPNGAGKSTLFNLLGGQAHPSSGRIVVHGADLTGQPPHVMWAHGVTRTFQRNQLFQNLTVGQNLDLAAMRPRLSNFRLQMSLEQLSLSTSAVLQQVGLAAEGRRLVKELAYGQQRQLELALALLGNPKILLLDEPTAGISPAETKTMLRILSELPRSITIMIVEHDMDVVFALCDRITVLHLGKMLADGKPEDIAADPEVRRIYMGSE